MSRRRGLVFALALLASGLHASCTRGLDDVGRNPRLFVHSETDVGEWVGLEGHWSSATGRYSVELPRVNSVDIDCWHRRMICVEHLSKLVQPADDRRGFLKRPMLFAEGNEYKIVEWSQSSLVARFEPRAADIEIRVSFSEKVAERTFRETTARGAAGAATGEALHWMLE